MAERVMMKFIPGKHVLTMQDPSGKEVPLIMLTWDEAKLMAAKFDMPFCKIPVQDCMFCGLRAELVALIAERGPQ